MNEQFVAEASDNVPPDFESPFQALDFEKTFLLEKDFYFFQKKKIRWVSLRLILKEKVQGPRFV